MLKITIKNPIENSVFFGKSIDVKYETTGIDANFKNLIFLINGIKLLKNDYFGTFVVNNLNIGQNEIIVYAVNKNNKKLLNTEKRIIFEVKDAIVPIKTKMSLFCKLSIPEFILSDYTQFTTFIQKYYEFLETSNNPYLVPFKQSDFYDIDKTSNYFTSFFYSQFLPDFPKQLAIDKQTGTPLNQTKIIKNIKKFYESKGNLNSFKFLFRILFDTEIDIKYPREKILKASGGKWIQRKSIKIFSFDDYKSRELNSRSVYQIDSFGNRVASARVSNLTIYRIDQYKVAELFLEDYIGIFDKNKKLYCDTVIDGAEETLEYDLALCPIKITIENKGYNYKVNDRVYLRPKNYVSINGLYYGDFSLQDLDNTDLPIPSQWQFIAETISGTNFTFNSSEVSDPNELYKEMDYYLSNTVEYINIDGVNFVPLPLNYWTFDAKDFGFNFNVPGFVKNTGKGYIGKVSKVDDKGRILKIDAVNFGFNYEARISELYDAYVISEKGIGFNGIPFSGVLCEYAPYYSGQSGILSSTNVIQDNNYYQSHSYEINSEIDIELYKANVLKLVHPSGYKLFGKNNINRVINNYTNIDYVHFEPVDYVEIPPLSINDIEINVVQNNLFANDLEIKVINK